MNKKLIETILDVGRKQKSREEMLFISGIVFGIIIGIAITLLIMEGGS